MSSQYPSDYNMVTNTTMVSGDSIYVLGKSPAMTNYTLCQLQSLLSPSCSTSFNVSGTTGGHMQAHCEDQNDKDSYSSSVPDASPALQPDWRVCELQHSAHILYC